jgi:hypothetical protein
MQWMMLATIVSGLLTATGTLHAGETVHKNHRHTDKEIIFPSSKGDVLFLHDMHVMVLKAEECIPCHRTNTPSANDTKSRFDQRVAHYFCRGCHRDKGVGPTECHGCHKKNI